MKRILIIICGFMTLSIMAPTVTSGDDIIDRPPRYGQMMGWGTGWSGEKSPGVAALLSLQPMPVDFGNFYVDDWGKGILYTSLEMAVFVPGVFLIGDRHGWGHTHARGDEGWTGTERLAFYSLLTGYITIKIISAYDAASTAEEMVREEGISWRFDPVSRTGMVLARIAF